MNLFDLQLDPRAAGFSPKNARGLAWASKQAYDSFTFSDARRDTQVLFIEKEEFAIIAFRGTSSVRDWMTDADFHREHLPNSARMNMEVHDGFFDALDGVWEKCYLAASRLRPGKPLFITGHSLGGALALLFAYLYGRQTRPQSLAGVYTFGAPRVGNAAFCGMFNALLKPVTFNLVNACDPVPLLPPLLAGYRDAGTEVFLAPTGGYVVDPFIGTELYNDVMGMFASWRQGRLAFLPNHFINRYQEKITAL
ncbi:MAG: lipase family protein [Verrucomicrobia bacterium]|nr:lipase family protein [Verrucomicrobiota bacterium]